jgi:hypothetical protein
MAMHVHACFSEVSGSMEAQLSEAAANNIDVLWWTEHDWRMAYAMYRTQVSFDSIDAEQQFGAPWIWTPTTSGMPTSTGGGIVRSPVSAKDPSPVGALEVQVSANDDTTLSAYGFVADSSTESRSNYHGCIAGLVMTIDVFPDQIIGGGFLEVLLRLSNHPARNGRHAGQYSISYRFGIRGAASIGGNPPGSRVTQGLTGIVTQALSADSYTTVVLTPVEDFAALWPDIDARDNNLPTFYLRAGLVGSGTAHGYFDNLTFSWPTLNDSVSLQATLMENYAPTYPSVKQIASQEYSRFDTTHMNVFGPIAVAPPVDVENLYSPDHLNSFYHHLCAANRAAGGVTSLNHVYGVSNDDMLLTGVSLSNFQTQTIIWLVTHGANGADLFEAGYRQRGGMPLEAHLAAWDACSRNGIIMTGNGCNDDHEGISGSWATKPNRFLTVAWAPSAQDPDILTALSTGRAFVADQTAFAGTLDLQLDDGTPMGGVTRRRVMVTRQLTVFASALPAGATVDVVRGPMDFASVMDPNPGTSVVNSISAIQFANGQATVSIPTETDAFFRVNVVIPDGSGSEIVAFSNPVFILNRIGAITRVDRRRITASPVTN